MAGQAESSSAGELKKELARKEAADSVGEVKRASLRYWQAPDGFCHFRGWLPPEEGGAFICAIERAELKDEQPNPETGEYDSPDEQAGNALVRVASCALIRDKDRDRATVVIHVPLDALNTGDGEGRLASGGYVSAEVVRRLACDGRIESIFEDARGGVRIGNLCRHPDAKMERYIRGRDYTCRFPGCEKRRHLHMHHIVFWTNQGKTLSTNMVCVCTRHHKLVHEGKWSIVGNPEPGPGPMSTLQVLRPDGTVFQPLQSALAPGWTRVKSKHRSGASRPPSKGEPEAWWPATLGAD